MLANWFGSRKSRSSDRGHFIRPKLEMLENRLAPSSMGMEFHDDNGGGDDTHDGGQPPGQVGHSDNDHQHINQNDDFNTEDDNAFQVVLDNANVNQFSSVAGLSQVQLQQGLITNLVQAVQTTPGATIQNAFMLMTDEFSLAQDTGLLVTGILTGMGTQGQQALVQEIHNLQSAIQQNPLEASVNGQVAGALAFDLGLQLSLSQIAGGQGPTHG